MAAKVQYYVKIDVQKHLFFFQNRLFNILTSVKLPLSLYKENPDRAVFFKQNVISIHIYCVFL